MTNPLAAEFRDVSSSISSWRELAKIVDVGNSEDPQFSLSRSRIAVQGRVEGSRVLQYQ
jgi:hypothetical protein